MKLLFDQNLSERITVYRDFFPGSTHVKAIGLERADDTAIGEWAKEHGFAIVSKDTDFYHRAMAFGAPPKFIWLRVGNCATSAVLDVLRAHHESIRAFGADDVESVLILQRAG